MEKKFDFEPFQKVLVKAYTNEIWACDIFSHCTKCQGKNWICCLSDSYEADHCNVIPYEGNENLAGTDKNYVEPVWIPEEGELCYHADYDGCDMDYGFFVDWHWHHKGNEISEGYIEGGNCFKTEEEAQALCDKLNEAIKDVK